MKNHFFWVCLYTTFSSDLQHKSGSDHVLTISFYLERATDHLLQSVTTVFTSAQLKQFDLNHCHGMCQILKKMLILIIMFCSICIALLTSSIVYYLWKLPVIIIWCDCSMKLKFGWQEEGVWHYAGGRARQHSACLKAILWQPVHIRLESVASKHRCQ